MSEKRMKINHDTAMAIWSKCYGKATRVKDFSGREMDKGSYDNRNSKYGWNLDHILPKSRGGKDSESNLICVNITTNDEKADKYPVFTSNDKIFEIIKVENHYEIREKATSEASDEDEEDKGINFFDHSAALKFFNECNDRDYFIDSIYIHLDSVEVKSVIYFIKEVFSNYNINFYLEKCGSNYNYGKSYNVYSIIENVDSSEKTSNLIDACVMINTYLKHYFKEKGLLRNYCILFKDNCFDYPTTFEYINCKDSNVNDSCNMLVINDNAKYNSKLQKKDLEYYNEHYKLWKYDYSYFNLRENLGKVEK